MREAGLDLPLVIGSDSSAARAIATKKGVCGLKHLEVKYLWAQEVFAQRKDVRLRATPGAENVADVGTKYLQATVSARLLEKMNFVLEHSIPDGVPARTVAA
eukprot:8161334-Alexandrium_andersonii.AAC.1